MWRKIQVAISHIWTCISGFTGGEDSFVFNSMPDTPSEITACERYADYFRPLVKSALKKKKILISQQKHMLWVRKRTVSSR